MKKIKQILRKIITVFSRFLSKTRVGAIIEGILIKDVMNRVYTVHHNDQEMKFVVPNHINQFRINTFSSKEPETLEWIDFFSKGSILWDIGANIGLYSIYAAKKKNCKIFAFEPSVFNLELLARNIFLNNLQESINIIPLALSNKMKFSSLKLTTTEWGGALSSFGEDIGWDGKPINDIFAFRTYGISMDNALSILQFPQPDYIKMDVDGIEHIILKGGQNVLKRVKSILVEVNDDFKDQAEKSKHYLSDAGLVLKYKINSEMVKNSSEGFANTFNQIWVRNNSDQ